ncbi:HtaA domain-containing protein [Streptomyces sp. NPDC048644]|uniref:HtaA domain-containing protein n=1 Tax=Streptomyces sp. NPDC048644 TaxID=3365582 RepID=UPI003723CD2C
MPAIRRPLALAAALATTAALGLPVTAFAADAHSATPRTDLKDGTLTWGVKESFRKYVTGIALGTIETTGGAEQAQDNGAFTFKGGTGTYDEGSHAVAATFRGSVRFTSKAHGFDIELADLKVATKGTGGAVTADVTASGSTQDDVPLASLDLSGVKPGGGTGGALTFAGIPTKLTAEGAKAFNGMYKAGQELDPATLSFTPATAPGKPAPGPDHTPAPTRPAPQPSDRPAGRPAAGSATGSTTESAAGSDTEPAAGSADRTGTVPGDKPARAATSAPAASPAIVDGTLDWGVKKSFRDYVTGPIGNGKAELSGGATASGAGYRFPKGHGTHDTAAMNAAFHGSVRFLAHSGALDMKFSDLKVKVAGTKGTLIADVSAKSRESGKVTTTDAMPVADLKVPSGALKPAKGIVTLDKVPATLTAAGAKAFDNMYRKGETLDPVTLAVSLDGDAALPSGNSGAGDGTSDTGTAGTGAASDGAPGFRSGSLAATGSPAPVGALIGTAASLVVAGAAATYATRRRAAR